ncbi:hypothetical protein BRADI_1g26654v3 [Brachypodium distachyon]|uniref:SWIM-type domain-containing protein n=1 Tax=Brachypodium distachyon TaxID=15368 RepID=A0A0Q3JDN1_BRADI|nr:hypothetical protein BRADI_1g26654v3 [Brachypodium distachyon]
MVFDSLKAAEEHYKMYARRYGFGIRYDYKRKYEVDGEISRVFIVCHRAGNPEPVVKMRSRNITERTGCKAKMMIKRRPDGWLVTEFTDEHNHPLIKKWLLTSFLRSHRDIPEEDKQFIRILHSVNIETSKQMQMMARLYGYLDNLGYTVKDVANYHASIRMEHKYTDMEDTMDYFRKLQQQDKDFYYKYKLDEEFQVQNIFWVDGAARRAYKHYNDCVSFDTTYMTNIYKMSFAPFIGINNHGQSIQFGCGFLRNELTEMPAYFMQSFYTFLQSTARSEGFNAVLKKYVNPQNSISDFVEQYAALQEKIMRAVSKQEADTAITTTTTWSWHPIEVHMSKVYTRNIYNRFQEEMQQVMSYNCSQLNSNSFMLVCITRFVPDHGNRSYRVTADVGEAKYSCKCCKFERDGMLCCHILKVMLQMNVLEMPDAYILNRWTWDAKEALIDEAAQGGAGRTEMPEESRRKMKFALISAQYRNLFKVPCLTDDGQRIAAKQAREMKKELADLEKGSENKSSKNGNSIS